MAEYPGWLKITFIDSKKIILSDNSEYSELTPVPTNWKIGDKVMPAKKESRFWQRSYGLTNIEEGRKQTISAFLIHEGSKITKKLGTSDAEVYPNVDMEIIIKRVDGELIWLEDDSKWHMYPPALEDPGPWEVGHVVIVKQPFAKKFMKEESKKYQMHNITTKKALTAMYQGYEP